MTSNPKIIYLTYEGSHVIHPKCQTHIICQMPAQELAVCTNMTSIWYVSV